MLALAVAFGICFRLVELLPLFLRPLPGDLLFFLCELLFSLSLDRDRLLALEF